MKKPDRISAILGAIVLVAVVVVGAFSVSAAGGDQADPLVTLSYLTKVTMPDLLNKVDEQVAANEKDLLDKLNAAIDSYSQEMEGLLFPGQGTNASFISVSLSASQTLYPQVGCEVLLRSGTAKVSVGSSPILLDTTVGSSLSSGGALESNHLYVATQAGGAVSVSSSAQFLVRGDYSIR